MKKLDIDAFHVEYEICRAHYAIIVRNPVGTLPCLHLVHDKLSCSNHLVVAQVIRG